MFWMLPLPFIAHSTGWFVAEAGRQPWLVYGLQLTADGASKSVTAPEIMTTIIGFTLVYIVAAIAAIYLAVEHIKKGPDGNPSHDVVEKEEARLWKLFLITLKWYGLSLITVLFAGFFLLEGFDYGTGILLPFIGKTDV